MVVLPCLAILARLLGALARHRLARYVAGVAVVWLPGWAVDAALPRLGLERFLLDHAANFWIDVRFYLGWALGLVLAPLPRQPGGTLATSRTPPSAPLPSCYDAVELLLCAGRAFAMYAAGTRHDRRAMR